MGSVTEGNGKGAEEKEMEELQQPVEGEGQG